MWPETIALVKWPPLTVPRATLEAFPTGRLSFHIPRPRRLVFPCSSHLLSRVRGTSPRPVFFQKVVRSFALLPLLNADARSSETQPFLRQVTHQILRTRLREHAIYASPN